MNIDQWFPTVYERQVELGHSLRVFTLTRPSPFVVSCDICVARSSPLMTALSRTVFLKQSQNTQPAINAATAIPPYVQTMYGSWETGESAIPIAAPTAIVTQKTLVTTARRFSGELLKAISMPVTNTQISASEPKT